MYLKNLDFSPLILVLTALLMIATACGTSSDSNDNGEWLIPQNQVVGGGPGRDGIPSIDNPNFAAVDQISYVLDERRVVIAKVEDEVKIYPHQILDWHEIVNDEIAGIPFALTYCPLTNTAIGWEREIDGSVVEFGVSGLLFRNNLIPFDRQSDSEWSQMQMRGVHGVNSGRQIQTVDLVETTWLTSKTMYPNAKVLTRETGFTRPYDGFEPYGQSYIRDNDVILFPVQNIDNRLENKERVHGVIADPVADTDAEVKAYVIDRMGEGVNVITDTFKGEEFVVVGSSNLDFAASFKTSIEGTVLNFEPVQDALPVVMTDNEGNEWDIFGKAVSGPRQGQKLVPTKSYTGFWFAWADFFPAIDIFEAHK